jgi:hypothetical protein
VINLLVPLDKAIAILYCVEGLLDLDKYKFSDLLSASELICRVFCGLPPREYTIYINAKIGRIVVQPRVTRRIVNPDLGEEQLLEREEEEEEEVEEVEVEEEVEIE